MLLTLLLDPLYYYGEQYELTWENALLASALVLLPVAAAVVLFRWAFLLQRRPGAQDNQRGQWLSIFTTLAFTGYLFWFLSSVL